MSWLVALFACLSVTALLGPPFGYPDAASWLAFWCATALPAATAWRLAHRAAAPMDAVDALVRAGVIAAALVVGGMLLLGTAGRLALPDVLALHAAALAAAVWATRGRSPEPLAAPSTGAIPPLPVALGAAVVVFAVAHAMWHAPFTLYDSLSYHLHFAGRWVQDHAIAIIPTPFSDEAQAYAPGNGELVFAWLMLPFHGDLLARLGQLPFALLGGVTLYAIARRLDAPPQHAAYPPLFFLLSRPIAEQMAGANVDLICAAAFLLSVYFAIVAIARDEVPDWALFGISAGLYLGTKYLALVYLPLLALLACARGLRPRAAWALPGIAALGLPWYLRNWIAAGSPIYPADLSLAGIAIARGAFTRAAMSNTVFHTSNVRLLPAMAAHAMGPALFVVWLPLAVAGWIRMARRGWWPHGALALLPLLMVPLYWYGLPVNVDSRFLMPAVGPALLPLAFVFTRRRTWNASVHVLLGAAALWVLVGLRRSLPASLPWFMNGWLALNGIIAAPVLAWFAVMSVVVFAGWLLVRRSPDLAVPALISAVAAGVIVFTLGTSRWCGSDGCEYLDTTSPFIRAGYADAWRWIDGNVGQATIAYTGINLPYPLAGPRLTNRVVYVNIDGRPRWRFDDYDRAYRNGRWAPSPQRLAVSSGELRPIADRGGPRRDAVRPRYERMDGDRDAWTSALEMMRVRYLFVALLSAYEIDYVWHNDRGFPIEDEWAASDPVRFQLVYRNQQVHIYSVDAGARAGG